MTVVHVPDVTVIARPPGASPSCTAFANPAPVVTATPATLPITPPRGRLRPVLLVCLLCAIGVAGGLLFGTEAGRQLRDVEQLKAVGADARRWVAGHPVAAPFTFLSIYI